MRQRVKLAQALVHSPELVVLDEPTNGLDPQGREEMLELVRRLSRDLGIRVLFSSHVLEDVERTCDAVVVLRDGRVGRPGRISDLRGARPARRGSARSATSPRCAAALAHAGVEVEDGEEGWLSVRGDAEHALRRRPRRMCRGRRRACARCCRGIARSRTP